MMNNIKIITLFYAINICILIGSVKCGQLITSDTDASEIVGTWYYCKDNKYGVETSRNSCPEVIFRSDSSGTYKGVSPEIDFKWNINNKNILFSFKNPSDAKLFLSDTLLLNFVISRDSKRIRLKLYNSENWYLLVRSIE